MKASFFNKAAAILLTLSVLICAALPMLAFASDTSGTSAVQSNTPVKVACVGDSITQGVGANPESVYSYPAQMQNILGDEYEVLNAGVSNTVVMDYERGHKYRDTAKYTESKEFLPDIVIIALGTNDAHSTMWDSGAPVQFRKDYTALAQEYMNLDSHPIVMLSLPMATWDTDRHNNNINGTIPIIKEIGAELGLQVIDMQSFTVNHPEWFPDKLHPGNDSYPLIAAEFAKYVTAAAESSGLIINDTVISGTGMEHTASLTDGRNLYYLVPDETDITKLAPEFKIAETAAITPAADVEQDFSRPVTYTVTGKNGRTAEYTVTVYTKSSASDKDKAAVLEYNEMLDALPPVIFRNTMAQAQAVCDKYSALTPLQKLLAGDSSCIAELEERIAEIGNSPIKVTCVGDSITQGVGANPESVYSYPAQMQNILGDEYEVLNAGVSNTVVMDYERGHKYRDTAKYTESKEFLPDIVIIALGTNDAHSTMWDSGAPVQFRKDYTALAQEYMNLPSHPVVMLSLPMATWDTDRHNNNINGTIPAIKAIAAELGLQVIDMQSFTANHPEWFPDKLHPGNDSYPIIAAEFAKYVTAAAATVSDYSIDSITVGGEALSGFEPEKYEYSVETDSLDTLPEISAVLPENARQTATVTQATPENPTATAVVQSGAGMYGAVYTVTFSVRKLPGDVDGNGVVNVSDILTLKTLIMNGVWSEEQLAVGDIDKNGSLSVSDILAIKNIIMSA